MGVNSLPPWRRITESPCRSHQLFVRSIVISLDTKFASVSTLVTGKRHPYAISRYGTSFCFFTVHILSVGGRHAGPYYISAERRAFSCSLWQLWGHMPHRTPIIRWPQGPVCLPLCVCVIVAILTEPLQASMSGADHKDYPHIFACCPICSSEVSSKCNIQLFFLFLLLSLKGLSF